ncbi:MAG: S8 family peptidase [Anaerocolumna sp.]
MTAADRYQIISNDYADLLIEYNDNMDVFEHYPTGSINIINRDFAILHIPEYNMTQDSISKFGYFSIPTCFGLLSSCQSTSFKVTGNDDASLQELTGQGVLVGFIDTGVDYRNPAFIDSFNTTRIISIWDQSIESSNYPEGFYYGTEYNRDQINQALLSNDPLSIVPSMDELGHGTALAGVTAGSPHYENGFSGVAPDAEYIIVKLKLAKPYLKEFFVIPETAVCYQENDIIMGVKYIYQMAASINRPLVICLGIGTGQSDHTGNRVVSRYLATVSENIGNAAVVSAGNEGNRRHHYYGEIISPVSSDNVFLNIRKNDPGFSMQFRSISPNQFWIDLYSPTGAFVAAIPPVSSNTMVFSYQQTSIIVDSQLQEPQANTHFIVFRIRNPIAGIWRLYIYEKTAGLPMQFHIWLPISDFIKKSTFFYRSNNNTTITAPGNQLRLICATAFNPENRTLYYYASKGFTISNHPKPDLAAPGVNILSPALNNQFTGNTGTSISAAYTAGIAALLMEWGITRNNYTKMNTPIIKRILIQGAVRDPALTYPNPDWGYGMIDISNINGIIELLEKAEICL